MSRRHPIIAVTGSSGAGTSTVKRTFDTIFRREGITAATIEGDAFHRYERKAMKERITASEREDRPMSHFGPDANEWAELERQFRMIGNDPPQHFHAMPLRLGLYLRAVARENQPRTGLSLARRARLVADQ